MRAAADRGTAVRCAAELARRGRRGAARGSRRRREAAGAGWGAAGFEAAFFFGGGEAAFFFFFGGSDSEDSASLSSSSSPAGPPSSDAPGTSPAIAQSLRKFLGWMGAWSSIGENGMFFCSTKGSSVVSWTAASRKWAIETSRSRIVESASMKLSA